MTDRYRMNVSISKAHRDSLEQLASETTGEPNISLMLREIAEGTLTVSKGRNPAYVLQTQLKAATEALQKALELIKALETQGDR
jgi:hypothetical protein